MTCRGLDQRIGEHSISVSSAVLQHMTSLGHDVAFNDPQILAHDNNRFRLGIKETLNIHSYKAYKSGLTSTQALMNVPYGNPQGPIVDCCMLHFSLPYTHVSF